MAKPEMFLASLDIRDAFYSVPMYEEHRNFLKFLIEGKPPIEPYDRRR